MPSQRVSWLGRKSRSLGSQLDLKRLAGNHQARFLTAFGFARLRTAEVFAPWEAQAAPRDTSGPRVPLHGMQLLPKHLVPLGDCSLRSRLRQ